MYDGVPHDPELLQGLFLFYPDERLAEHVLVSAIEVTRRLPPRARMDQHTTQLARSIPRRENGRNIHIDPTPVLDLSVEDVRRIDSLGEEVLDRELETRHELR